MKKGGVGGKNANFSGSDFENKNSFLNLVKLEPGLSYEFLDTETKGKSIDVPFEI